MLIFDQKACFQDPPSLKFHYRTDTKFYLSMVKAIMVIMDTWVTNSLANVMKPQPIFPKGQGYWCHIKNISIGITERRKKCNITIKNISIGITEKRKKSAILEKFQGRFSCQNFSIIQNRIQNELLQKSSHLIFQAQSNLCKILVVLPFFSSFQ